MKPKRPVLALRLDPETETLVHALGRKLGLSMSAVVRLCVRRTAEMERIALPLPTLPQEPEDSPPKQHAAA